MSRFRLDNDQPEAPVGATSDPTEADHILHVGEKDAAPPLSVRSEAARRLRVLYDVAQAMTQLEDTGALLRRMLDAILWVLGCERGVIGLRDPSGGLAIEQRVVSFELSGGEPL
jgi:hypothetical protein